MDDMAYTGTPTCPGRTVLDLTLDIYPRPDGGMDLAAAALVSIPSLSRPEPGNPPSCL